MQAGAPLALCSFCSRDAESEIDDCQRMLLLMSCSYVASLAAVITILCLGLEPFIQQLISYPLEVIPLESKVAVLNVTGFFSKSKPTLRFPILYSPMLTTDISRFQITSTYCLGSRFSHWGRHFPWQTEQFMAIHLSCNQLHLAGLLLARDLQ